MIHLPFLFFCSRYRIGTILYMKGIRFPIFFVTLYLMIYTVLHHAGASLNILLPMFSISPILVIWMVYKVLKNGTPSGKTFDDQFYDDMP